MKSHTFWITLLLAAVLSFPAGMAFGQWRDKEIESANVALAKNETKANILVLASLQFQEGVDYLKANDYEKAIDNIQAAVWNLEDTKWGISDTDSLFVDARYGLSFALVQNNNGYEALLVLDKLLESNPGFGKGRYLLGLTLLNLPGQDNVDRGMDVLRQLAVDGNTPYNQWGEKAATRAAYNHSTLTHSQGNADGAMGVLGNVTNEIGSNKGASGDENSKVQYAQGIYALDSGDTEGGVEKLEALHADDSGFQLENSVTLTGILSNAYYQAGVGQLEAGGDSGAQAALDSFTKSGDLGGSSENDLRHGIAIAHTLLGDLDSADSVLRELANSDPDYYNRIKMQ